MNNPRSAVVVRWTARISGGLLLIFLLFMLIGHLFGDANGPNGMTFSSSSDAVAFVLFPICLIIGLAIAYKWEMQGGLLATLSMVALCIVHPASGPASLVLPCAHDPGDALPHPLVHET